MRIRRPAFITLMSASFFRLFKLQGNGERFITYYERAHGPLNRPKSRLRYSNGEYKVVDTESCTVIGSSQSHDLDIDSKSDARPNQNGVIRYKGRHFIFDLFSLDGRQSAKEYRLNLDEIRPTDSSSTLKAVRPACAYSTVSAEATEK